MGVDIELNLIVRRDCRCDVEKAFETLTSMNNGRVISEPSSRHFENSKRRNRLPPSMSARYSIIFVNTIRDWDYGTPLLMPPCIAI
jgi:hypothetical protein